jgi:hypothetical protein
VHCSTFGELNLDTPFQNRIILSSQEAQLQSGLTITGTGPAKFTAFYTP